MTKRSVKIAMKKLSFLVALLFLLSFNVFAMSTASNVNAERDSDVASFVEKTCKDQNKNLTVSKSCPLYDADDNVIAWGYTLSPTGYLIVKDQTVVEFSLVNESPFSGKEKTYFGGPLNYYTKTSSGYKGVRSAQTIDKDRLQNEAVAFSNVKTPQAAAAQSQFNNALSYDSSESCYLSGTPRTYTYNPNGVCGSTASAVFLMYYHDYKDSFVVPSWYVTSDGVSLINLLIPHIDGDVPGSSEADVENGLGWYLRWRGISSTYCTYSTSLDYSNYKSIIASGRPAIVLMNGNPTYGDHWVVGHGYYYYASGRDAWCYYVVDDLFGNNGISINSSYVTDIVYFNR